MSALPANYSHLISAAWNGLLTADNIRDAARTFKFKTGSGSDNVQPRLVAELSDTVLTDLAQIISKVVNSGEFPKQAQELLSLFIPKSAGGLRPIGSATAVYRIGFRTVGRGLTEWEVNLGGDAFVGGKGSPPADIVAATISAHGEYARAVELQCVSVLLDVTKCFDTVLHQRLITRCIKLGFPPRQLRLALLFFRTARRIAIGNTVSVAFHATQGIVAGCASATRLLRAYLNPVVEEMCRLHRSIIIKVWVDDATLTAIAKRGVAGQLAADASKWLCIKLLEDNLAISKKAKSLAAHPAKVK